MKPQKKAPVVILPALLLLLSAASLILYALHGSLAGTKAVNHHFDFGGPDENEDVEILNWRYGNSKLAFTKPPDYQLASGHIGQGSSVGGTFPVGDSLYVTWRVESTGKLYEDTVDLKSRLPSDITDKDIHFVIKGSQLYVYLIEGSTSAQVHAAGASDCPILLYRMSKCTELYPETWKNF